MKKLLKIYGFNSDMQYFEMVADSFHNGNITQAKEQFNSMPKSYKVNFLKAATVGDWQSSLDERNISILFDQL